MDYHVPPRTDAIEKLENFIIVNRISPNMRIPSERDLCKMWGMNRTTLHFAVNTLVEEGRLYRVKGAGTYVAEPKQLRNLLGVSSLTQEIRQQGTQFTTKILSVRVIDATKQVSKKLKIPLGKKVFEIIRLRMISSVPCIIETLYLDCERFPDFDKYYSEKSSMHAIFTNIYKVDEVSGEEKISVTYTSEEESQLLGVPEESPIFFTSGITMTGEKEIIEYYKALFRADRFKFVSMIDRNKLEGD